MNTLLEYLISNFSFLYNELGARFVDSRTDSSNAMLILEMENLRLKFTKDRDQLFLEFQSSHQALENDWFSYDIVRQLLTNEIVDSALLDEKKVIFIRENINKIAKAFSKENKKVTEGKLHDFERKRAKRLFG